MEHGLKVLALVALILPGVAGATDRSNSCKVKQDPTQGSWTVYGTIEGATILAGTEMRARLTPNSLNLTVPPRVRPLEIQGVCATK